MPLFAEDWNAVVDALDDLYRGAFGPLQSSLIPYLTDFLDLGSADKRWKDVFAQYVLAQYIHADQGDFLVLYLAGKPITEAIAIDLTSVASDILPSVADQYMLGSSDKRWKGVVAGYIQSDRGDFLALYVGGEPVTPGAPAEAVTSLENLYTDIWPGIDSAYDIGKPDKRWSSIWAIYGYFDPLWTSELWIDGKKVTIPLPVQYLLEEYMSVAYFYQQALDQLYSLFGEDLREIKLLLSEKLAREVYETKTYMIDTSTESSPLLLPIQPPNHQLVIRNWYIVTNSNEGEIELRSVKTYIPIAWVPCAYVKQAGNTDTWIELYYDDYPQLIWTSLTTAAKILLQLSFLTKYVGASVR